MAPNEAAELESDQIGGSESRKSVIWWKMETTTFRGKRQKLNNFEFVPRMPAPLPVVADSKMERKRMRFEKGQDRSDPGRCRCKSRIGLERARTF
ncbi:uncharacterized protein A4U43_C04F29480 [Asparagus officinalis]|uniref:Uncharacterized protein n=1 Tax=Asparagus officinalis TaxID=4686 RepID=A0A5P1F977_ASPOF|nr:uncharacterized protein A4U43_C04F29480 [Asparagus officinalis]